jgi:hypothetical protein
MTKANTTADEVSDVDEGQSSEQFKARARLRKLIQERGITPVAVDQLRAMGDLWPEDESVDDFLEWREQTRKEDRSRRLP